MRTIVLVLFVVAMACGMGMAERRAQRAEKRAAEAEAQAAEAKAWEEVVEAEAAWWVERAAR